MTDIDDLLQELTGTPRPETPAAPVPPLAGRPRPDRPGWLGWVAVGGLALLVLAVAAAAALWKAGDGDGSSAVGSEAATTLGAAASLAPASSASTAPAAPGPVASSTTAPASPAAGGTDPAENPQGAVRYAVASGGRITLRGEAPDRATADRLMTEVTAATGMPVADELRIVGSAPAATALPVYFADPILFGFNSIEVAPGDLWQLDVATRLLAAQPDLKLHVVAHTDATGTDAQNIEVAEQRATAVCNYLLSIGAQPGQIVLDPVGEAAEQHDGAVDADADRNVQLVVEGSLAG